jgi:hypothetical protein
MNLSEASTTTLMAVASAVPRLYSTSRCTLHQLVNLETSAYGEVYRISWIAPTPGTACAKNELSRHVVWGCYTLPHASRLMPHASRDHPVALLKRSVPHCCASCAFCAPAVFTGLDSQTAPHQEDLRHVTKCLAEAWTPLCRTAASQ